MDKLPKDIQYEILMFVNWNRQEILKNIINDILKNLPTIKTKYRDIEKIFKTFEYPNPIIKLEESTFPLTFYRDRIKIYEAPEIEIVYKSKYSLSSFNPRKEPNKIISTIMLKKLIEYYLNNLIYQSETFQRESVYSKYNNYINYIPNLNSLLEKYNTRYRIVTYEKNTFKFIDI